DVGLIQDAGGNDQRQHHEQGQRRDREDDAGGDRRQPPKRGGALDQRTQRDRDQQAEDDRDQRQPQVNHRQRPGVVEVGEQIAHAQPAPSSAEPSLGKAFGRWAFSITNTSSACTPPMGRPSASTATPSPAGDDKAASSACRSESSGRNSDPPP